MLKGGPGSLTLPVMFASGAIFGAALAWNIWRLLLWWDRP